MKQVIIITLLLSTVQLASAQERLSKDEALQYADAVSKDAKQLKATPIPTDVDTQKPVAIREGDYGGMVLPQKDLELENIAKAAKGAVTPIGQLWLLKLTPMRDGEAISSSKLRLATVQAEGSEVTVPQCALGIRRTSEDKLELVLFGKDKDPILATPIKAIDTKQELPVDMSAERESDSGRLTVKILGKYQATFQVTELDI